MALGPGVLVDGRDFSDDKRLLGRTCSCPHTRRYRADAGAAGWGGRFGVC